MVTNTTKNTEYTFPRFEPLHDLLEVDETKQCLLKRPNYSYDTVSWENYFVAKGSKAMRHVYEAGETLL